MVIMPRELDGPTHTPVNDPGTSDTPDPDSYQLDRTSRYTLTVLEVPKSVNDSGGGVKRHWSKGYKEKRRWQDRYLTELMVARVVRGMTFCTVNIEIMWKSRRRRDVENYRHPIVKPLLDALVEGNYLEDDTDEFVKVGDVTFSYPKPWPYPALGLSGIMAIRLDATY